MLDQYYAFTKFLRVLAIFFLIGATLYITWSKLFSHVTELHLPNADELKQRWDEAKKTEMDKILERAEEEKRKEEEAKRRQEEEQRKRDEEIMRRPSTIIGFTSSLIP